MDILSAARFKLNITRYLYSSFTSCWAFYGLNDEMVMNMLIYYACIIYSNL